MVNATCPSVHPVEAPPPQTHGEPQNPMPEGRMNDIPGMPGTRGGLTLRLNQFVFALVAGCVMASTHATSRYTTLRYFVNAVSWQCLWSLSLAFVDLYAILVKRRLRNPKVVSVFAVGDGISSTITFAAASAAAGISVLDSNDFHSCVRDRCTRYQASVTMAFLSWFAVSSSFVLNFWTLASKSSH